MSAKPAVPAAVPDQAERERALDPRRSFIVQAPAGSGKTGLLTQRYLKLLAGVEAPEEVVAITFTRKAANEMRNRVLAALDAARAAATTPDVAPPAAHEAHTRALAQAVLARDAQRDWQLADNPGRLRISTIDSLCAALTRQMPLLARLGAPPATLEDATPLYRDAARELLADLEAGERWSPAIERLLLHLDNNLADVEALLAGMLARRDQWLRHLAGPEGIERATLEQALARLAAEHLKELRAAVPPGAVAEWLALARYAAGNLAADEAASPIRACAGLEQLPDADPEALAPWQGLAAVLLTAAGEWRQQANKNIGFPAKTASGSAAEKQTREDMKVRHAALLASLADNDHLLDLLQAVPTLPPGRYDDSQWAILEALGELLPLAAAQLRLVFQRRGEVDFTEVALSALHALGTPEAPTDLALSLDYRIHHLLVDEFQDTSLSQYELLRLLTAGWQPDDGRSLFVVGDPMQSIYRFRQAEVGLYLEARHAGIGGVALTPLTLSANFRSQAGIVAWVNSAFAQVLPAMEDPATSAVPYAAAHAAHPALPGAAVRVHASLAADAQAEAQTVLGLVKSARAARPDGDIAILVRSRAHVADIAAALQQAGLRYSAVEIERLGHRPVVQDLLALTRALAHAADRAAALAVLRAPWCGLTLADLHSLAADAPHASLWDLLRDAERLTRLSADGRARLKRTRDVLLASLDQRQRVSARRAVEAAWLALGGPACVQDATDLLDAEVYFDLLDELATSGDVVDFAQLAQRVGALFALPDVDADGRLQIMTIHKAKGLEFDTVIVPGLGRPPRSAERQLLLWTERPAPHGGADLLLAPIRATGDSDDAIYAWLRRYDARKGRNEDGRLLYVAATRARQRLHLLGHARVSTDPKTGEQSVQPAAASLLAQLWPAVRQDFEAALAGYTPRDDQTELALTAPPSLRRLTAGWTPPAPPDDVPWQVVEAPARVDDGAPIEFVWASESIRHVGTVVHRLLQRIAEDGLNVWNAARIDSLGGLINQMLRQLGVPDTELANATTRAQDALRRTLNDERGRWLFDPSHQDARNEYALSAVLDGEVRHVILDRSFIDTAGVRWIVDYKTSAHQGTDVETFLDNEQQRYTAQLQRYARIMAQRETRPIRLGLYFPLLGGWREWAG